MPRKKVKPEQTREHERRAWELRTRGWSQEAIAAELGITQPGVSKILARVSDRYLRQMEDKVGRVKAAQTAQLDHILREALDAWERSKKPSRTATTTTTTKPTEGDGAGSESTTQEVRRADEQVGDVTYLEQARAALADVRKIWGADAPVKTIAEVTNRQVEDVTEMTTSELYRLAAEGKADAPAGGTGDPPQAGSDEQSP